MYNKMSWYRTHDCLWGTKEIQVYIKYSLQENVLLDNVYFLLFNDLLEIEMVRHTINNDNTGLASRIASFPTVGLLFIIDNWNAMHIFPPGIWVNHHWEHTCHMCILKGRDIQLYKDIKMKFPIDSDLFSYPVVGWMPTGTNVTQFMGSTLEPPLVTANHPGQLSIFSAFLSL